MPGARLIGLEYIAAGYMQLAAFGVECRMKSAPQINVVASGVDPVIEHRMTVAQLNKFKPQLNTQSPFGPGVETHVQGLTSGKIGMEGAYEFETETWDILGKVCLYVKRVDVKIALDPKIYIAREYPEGSCHYNAVLAHEKKHWRVDRDVVNKYTGVIVRGVNNALKQVGFVHGPYDVASLPALQQQIGGVINGVIEGYAKNLNAERLANQRKIDTLAEYRKVAAQCNGR